MLFYGWMAEWLIQMKDGASEKDEPIFLPDANAKFHIYLKIKMIFF